MKERPQFGKHGPVIAIDESRDISQEPEMKKLVEVSRAMTKEEKDRTGQYLKDKDSHGVEPKEVIRCLSN
jgi:hypothetical protein